ncbi:2-succinylbenzoate--CoA ligase [Nostoc sp. UCD121]|uniref:2-succinylbenzoate--CoA ligase n=1 Tax=unclassified Nostoc TaxID=2593658 RepID=UPI0016236173|nr:MULTISPECIES: 2-succinylbenzoate--CoA ligase [unclassified Nostoc]MBC1222282.1 2-succinylbenzoate--CoA ligase [Nostoc sp. UCD120]MBC1274826.1 2-succinylbenzoate--CoA ligase [Nostoc sp. UCD121]MBC1297755.1 2-succinylbenzoate--CoA ligase [Nostoc sp. UCD122]
MERPLDYLNNLAQNDWLIGYDSRKFNQIAQELYLELTQLSECGTPPKIILAEREPLRFLASFIAACAANCPVFLCNPDWGTQEWQQVFDLVQPDIILGMGNGELVLSAVEVWGMGNEHNNTQCPIPNSIMIATGGSSGQIKFAIHTWETLISSVQGFTEYFQIKQVNSFCVLPLYHVSGLMQFMRSFTTAGKLAIQPFKAVESDQILNIKQSEFFISLVPTQLQRLLQNPELTEWLSQFNTVLLGGAPAWNEVLEKARFHHIRLSPTYGMTETASQIATLKPDDFLGGKISSGQILPHAKVTIRNQQGDILNSNQIGNITIYAQSLALGYYPITKENQTDFQVDDLGFLDEQGHLNIVGRNSDKIITGGENIYPAEIESAIQSTQMVADICVIGIPDKHWGQALTAIYIPKKSDISALKIQTLLKDKLSKFKIPKYWIPQQNLPRNSQGKINRQQLQQIATEFLQNPIT